MRELKNNAKEKVDNKKSIEELCSTTWKPLYRFIYHKVQNKEEAEDILQESYVKAIKYMKKNHIDMDKSMAFLKTVSLNVLRDRWRKNKREGISFDLDNTTPKEVAIGDSTDEIISREVIENALMLLNEDQRRVIELRILKGYSVADAAKVMNKDEVNIRVLQYRALQNLRKRFKQNF